MNVSLLFCLFCFIIIFNPFYIRQQYGNENVILSDIRRPPAEVYNMGMLTDSQYGSDMGKAVASGATYI